MLRLGVPNRILSALLRLQKMCLRPAFLINGLGTIHAAGLLGIQAKFSRHQNQNQAVRGFYRRCLPSSLRCRAVK